MEERIPNPISGSQLRISRVLSLKQFNAIQASSLDEYEDTGEGNETIALYRHKDTGDIILVKLTKD